MTPTNSQPPEKTSAQRYRRLLKYLKPAKWPFVVGVLAGMVYAITSGLAFPLILKGIAPVLLSKSEPSSIGGITTTNVPVTASVDAVVAASTSNEGRDTSLVSRIRKILKMSSQEQITRLARWMFGDDYRDKLLLTACLFIPLVFLVRAVAAILSRYWINYAGFQMLEALRTDVFRRLQELPLAFYQRHKSGDLTSRLMTDTEQLKNVVVLMSQDIIKQPLTLVFSLGFLVYLAFSSSSAFFVLITLLSIGVCIIPVRLAARRLIKKSKLLASETGELNAVVTEGLQSPMEIQAYNLQPSLTERFTNSVRSIFRLSMKTVKYQSFVNPVIEFIAAVGCMAALYLGVKSGMDPGVFVAMGAALFMAYEPVKKLSILNAVWKMGAASLERLEHVLDAEDSVPQPVEPRTLPQGPADIVFENVGFTYQPRENGSEPSVALQSVNARFHPGEVVALVGKSGAGKSTFISLIPRFYDATAGRVIIGDVDVRAADKVALRDRIALVPQMPVLFNATIAENIRMGRLGATDEQVRAAAQKAFVADFINTLPQGYDTIVGERGASLSGGQRQRIAIARAFLKDAPILILDEATSALDSESEQKVQQALQELVQGRTTFMIAHRFASISLATRVLVFEDGRITGDAAPEELRRSHKVFRHMTELQQLK